VFAFLGDAEIDVERDAKVTYSLKLAFRNSNGGSVDRDGEDSTDDGEELSGEHCCVG
jgi:hypothetical protein